jgi:tRNA modification GTPase
MNGMKVKIIDTAGIGKPGNVVEEEGIKRVKQKISETDLIIWLLDGSQTYSADDAEVFHTIRHRNFLVAINKIDLPQSLERDTLSAKGLHWAEISALKDRGIEELKEKAFTKLTGGIKKHNALLITNMRHRDALTKVKNNIERAMLLRERNEPLELIAFELHEGLHHLGEITGETCTEGILQEIFHQFCIGK